MKGFNKFAKAASEDEFKVSVFGVIISYIVSMVFVGMTKSYIGGTIFYLVSISVFRYIREKECSLKYKGRLSVFESYLLGSVVSFGICWVGVYIASFTEAAEHISVMNFWSNFLLIMEFTLGMCIADIILYKSSRKAIEKIFVGILSCVIIYTVTSVIMLAILLSETTGNPIERAIQKTEDTSITGIDKEADDWEDFIDNFGSLEWFRTELKTEGEAEGVRGKTLRYKWLTSDNDYRYKIKIEIADGVNLDLEEDSLFRDVYTFKTNSEVPSWCEYLLK